MPTVAVLVATVGEFFSLLGVLGLTPPSAYMLGGVTRGKDLEEPLGEGAGAFDLAEAEEVIGGNWEIESPKGGVRGCRASFGAVPDDGLASRR